MLYAIVALFITALNCAVVTGIIRYCANRAKQANLNEYDPWETPNEAYMSVWENLWILYLVAIFLGVAWPVELILIPIAIVATGLGYVIYRLIKKDLE